MNTITCKNCRLRFKSRLFPTERALAMHLWQSPECREYYEKVIDNFGREVILETLHIDRDNDSKVARYGICILDTSGELLRIGAGRSAKEAEEFIDSYIGNFAEMPVLQEGSHV